MSVRRLILPAATLAYWTLYLVAVLEAVHYRERLRVLGPLAVVGGFVGLGLLIVAVRCWPSPPRPETQPVPRQRPVVAVSPLAAPLRTQPDMTAWEWVTRPGPRGPNESTRVLEVVPDPRPVAVAEPPDLEEPLRVRDFGSFLDVREEGHDEGYDEGYDDAAHGRPHRKAGEPDSSTDKD